MTNTDLQCHHFSQEVYKMIHSKPILGVKISIRSILSLRTWNELFHAQNSHPVLTLMALEVKCYLKTLDESLSLSLWRKKKPLQTNLSFCWGVYLYQDSAFFCHNSCQGADIDWVLPFTPFSSLHIWPLMSSPPTQLQRFQISYRIYDTHISSGCTGAHPHDRYAAKIST